MDGHTVALTGGLRPSDPIDPFAGRGGLMVGVVADRDGWARCWGFTSGFDNNENTPAVFGGTCTKIE